MTAGLMEAQVAETGGEVDEGPTRFARYKYPQMRKTLGNFTLHVRPSTLAFRQSRKQADLLDDLCIARQG